MTEAVKDVTFNAPSMGAIFSLIMASILLGVSGFISASEIAYFSLSPTDVAELELKKDNKDKRIQLLRADGERTLATILIGNNCVNVTIIMLCNYIFTSLFEFKQPWIEFLCITVLLTFLHKNYYC